MSNWFKHGKTDLCVGFLQQGNICEGGNCEHLKENDQAFGYTSENDSFGSEYYLYCETCYNEFLEERKVVPVECHDCKGKFPRNETCTHIPYFVDEEPRAKWAKIICNGCRVKPRHLARLDADEEERSHDQRNQDDWNNTHLPDDGDTEDPDDFVCGEIDRLTRLDELNHCLGSDVKITGTPLPVYTDRTTAALLSNLDSESSHKPAGKLIILFPRDEGKTSGLKSIVVKPKDMVLTEEALSFIKNGPKQ